MMFQNIFAVYLSEILLTRNYIADAAPVSLFVSVDRMFFE